MNDDVATAPCRATPIVLSGVRTWTVVDGRGLPVDAVDGYLHWLRATGKSPNTVRAYARHLALLFRWLDAYGVKWDEVTFDQLLDFSLALRAGAPPLQTRREGGRSPATVRAVAAAVKEFYEHHRLDGRGPADLRLTRTKANSSRTTHHFLAHVEKDRPVERNRLAEGQPSQRSANFRIIRFDEDFERLMASSRTVRDRLLLSLFYDCGLRLGGALGLRHSDLDPMRRRLTLSWRPENGNGVLSKRRDSFVVHAPRRTFDLYRRYLLEELEPAGIDSDYLFVNLRPGRWFGRPCSEGNIEQMIRRVGAAAGIDRLHPHMLRHTHATALAKAGWTNAEIAARLGQTHASSADVYIHLSADDIGAKMDATSHLIWRPAEAAPA